MVHDSINHLILFILLRHERELVFASISCRINNFVYLYDKKITKYSIVRVFFLWVKRIIILS